MSEVCAMICTLCNTDMDEPTYMGSLSQHADPSVCVCALREYARALAVQCALDERKAEREAVVALLREKMGRQLELTTVGIYAVPYRASLDTTPIYEELVATFERGLHRKDDDGRS